MRTFRFRGAVRWGALLCALSVGVADDTTAGAAAAAKTRLASCDQAPGVTVQTSTRWRLFRPHPSSAFDDPGEIWICRRSPEPARRFARLAYHYRTVNLVGGDLAEFANSGRYVYERYLLNLATLRWKVIEGDRLAPSGENEFIDGLLTGSGAVVSRTQTLTRDPETDAKTWNLSPVRVDDATGRHELLPAETVARGAGSAPPAGTAGSPDRAVAVSREDDAPESVVYATTTDGQPVRFVPTGAAESATWGVPRMRYFAKTFRRPPTRGVRTTPLLGAGYELSERLARGGRKASLSIRRPALTAYDDLSPEQATDLIARLAPGSGAEADVDDGGVILARFSDRPDERRARIPKRWGVDRRYGIDLPAPRPDAVGPIASGADGTTAIATADRITLIVREAPEADKTTRTVPVAGATQLAMYVTASGETYDHVVYWTDSDGNPASYAFSTPE